MGRKSLPRFRWRVDGRVVSGLLGVICLLAIAQLLTTKQLSSTAYIALLCFLSAAPILIISTYVHPEMPAPPEEEDVRKQTKYIQRSNLFMIYSVASVISIALAVLGIGVWLSSLHAGLGVLFLASSVFSTVSWLADS